MEATGWSVTMFMGANEPTQPQHRNTQREPTKSRTTQTDRMKHTHAHMGGRSSTYWAHLGGFHNERGTVATQVPTRRKQMRLLLAHRMSKVG